MKKIPIKFRGKSVFCGRFVYGDLIHYVDGAIGICPIGENESAEVEPESIAQLVGYDANGMEVYEGDELLITTINTLHPATIEGYAVLSADIKSDGKYYGYDQLFWLCAEKHVILNKGAK